MSGANCHWLHTEIQPDRDCPGPGACWCLLGFCLVAFRIANLSAVPEHRSGSDIYLADVAEVSRRAREFTCSSFNVYGVGHNSKQGLRDRNGCRDGWIEQDGISCFGNPVPLLASRPWHSPWW